MASHPHGAMVYTRGVDGSRHQDAQAYMLITPADPDYIPPGADAAASIRKPRSTETVAQRLSDALSSSVSLSADAIRKKNAAMRLVGERDGIQLHGLLRGETVRRAWNVQRQGAADVCAQEAQRAPLQRRGAGHARGRQAAARRAQRTQSARLPRRANDAMMRARDAVCATLAAVGLANGIMRRGSVWWCQ